MEVAIVIYRIFNPVLLQKPIVAIVWITTLVWNPPYDRTASLALAIGKIRHRSNLSLKEVFFFGIGFL